MRSYIGVVKEKTNDLQGVEQKLGVHLLSVTIIMFINGHIAYTKVQAWPFTSPCF
jgi:hypothetical protein